MMRTTVVCICGAGTMGSGIAQLCAQAGFTTIQFDVNAAMLTSARQQVTTSLERLLAKEKITAAQLQQTLERLHFTDRLTDCRANVIIEAIVEKKEAKTTLFNQLAQHNNERTLFATNTSSIAVTEIAAAVPHPERVLGMHFFNPAPVMKLVEVIRAAQTSETAVQQIVALAKALGKIPVVCSDAPGFIVNRVARPYYLEAMRLVEAGHTTVEQADKLLESAGFKMGPFKLMDLIGMDVNFSVSNIVWQSLQQPPRLKPAALQQQKVEAGELGRKTGKGFYQY